jgi:small-conductance mechanosensitive channel
MWDNPFMENFNNWLQTYLGIDTAAQKKLLISVLVVATLWLIHRVLRGSVTERIQSLERRYQWQKALGYTFTTLGILTVSLVWFEGVQYAATYLGLVSAGIAIALKDPITNIVAWVFILWRKPFEVGDRIEIGQFAGDVVDQRIFQFSMMEIGNWVDSDQSTGRILHIPNGMIFTSGVANYTHGPDYIWNEIPVLITFESHWEKAKGLLQEIADAHDVSTDEKVAREFEAATRKFLLKYNKLTPIVYTNVLESGVLLTIRYLCKPRQRRGTTESIWEAILHTFAKHKDIDLAYPTTRFYSHETSER